MSTWEGWIADAVLALALVAMAVYLWRLTSTLDAVSRRQALQQQRMEQLPSTELLTDVRVHLARLESLIEGTAREVNSSSTRLRRVEDYLMEAKRRNEDTHF